MVGSRSFSLALLLLVLLPASAAANTQIIVKRDRGLDAAERADLRSDADVRYVERLPLPRTEVVTAAPGDVRDAVRDLNRDPDVVYAEPNRLRHSAALDTHLNLVWGIPQILADDAWLRPDPNIASTAIMGDGQIVAVVDSGIDENHPDLVDQIHSGRNFVFGEGTGYGDGNGHGTHVSGTIAAEYDNGQGVAGVAPHAQIMALRALDNQGGGYDSDIAAAFAWAGTHGVSIVNASLGGEGASQTLRDAIADAPNTLFVVAAANGGIDGEGDNNDHTPIYPCNTPEPNVLCVGASTQSDEVAGFSNYGDRSVDVFAPGEWTLSTYPIDQPDEFKFPGEPYAYSHGTSMATPHVSGAAALVLQADPTLSPVQLKQTLLAGADTDNDFGDSVSGGRLNADRAVELALNGTPLVDTDGDGWADAADACPAVDPGVPSSDGCAPDDDWDRSADAVDNCVGVSNPGQNNLDGDAWGDACDANVDGDGLGNWPQDACPTVAGSTSYSGCPPPPTTPPPAPPTTPTTPPADADGDGVYDVSDACLGDYARTDNGCPLAQVSKVSAKVKKRRRKRSVRLTIATSRVATVRVTVERKKRRRWVRVTRKTLTTSHNRARLRVSRLRRGRHRVRISISSGAGRGESVTKRFRVR